MSPHLCKTRKGGPAADSAGSLVVTPLDAGVARAVQKISRVAVPDMPNRIIAATALHLGAELETRDRAVW
jgi:hypothetical protein